MVLIGYTLSSEEVRPNDLATQARWAEEAGFAFASISDHFHPWLSSQNQSPFVWSVLGAISQTTERILIGTGVTCPLIRTHPAIIAQAAATVADMLPGRFYLGVGTGELLNEHITGEKWPPIAIRQEMLREALEIIRLLWQGENCSRQGRYYTVENAQLFTIPETLPDIYVAASGTESAELAGEIGDGLISTAPNKEAVNVFKQAGGSGPLIGQLTICWGKDKAEQAELARKLWGFTILPGQFSQELALPQYYEDGLELVTPEKVMETIVCGPDIEEIHRHIQEFVDAGFTHVYLHQVGPEQKEFIDMAAKEILPRYTS